ncbi:NADP-dependent 3-hydroxy acid dehydrogenase YdfG [Promicromonospora sp. AC04]|uniref:SDR family oxidoreductase n=1 Tax=Promicromonospora sp. AC04 TaxID=2135723 RepID=UPI000D3B68A8|nr:SDR family oxidoreductase [Promicromonospora sp. AC04]PUB27732.1 NADP-dependent 3-hydroxy acid dehydrogenase YdfG [Promicromonospora sp. AC04]
MTTSYADNARIALVTGGNKGLGLAVARRLGEAGATVLIGGRDATRTEDASASLRDVGLKAWPLTLDVTVDASAVAAAEQIEREYGRLDILVNNAGILPEATTPDLDRPLDLAMFRMTFDTNLFGVVSVTQAMLPLLRRSGAGRIVNVSTTMGSLTDQLDPRSPYFGLVLPAYQGSKAALNALTIALSKSLADTSILVNSVCPGWVQTDLGGPDNRAAAPTPAEEAAPIVADLALLGADGASGTFVDGAGPVAW